MGCHSDRMVLMLVTNINIAVVRAATMVDTDDGCVYRSVCPREPEVIPNMLYDNPMSKRWIRTFVWASQAILPRTQHAETEQRL